MAREFNIVDWHIRRNILPTVFRMGRMASQAPWRGRRKMEEGGNFSIQDAVNFLFEGDDEDDKVVAKAPKEDVTAPSEDELLQIQSEREDFANEQRRSMSREIAMQDFDVQNNNVRSKSAVEIVPHFNNPYKAGERGQQIISEISSALGYTPEFNSVFRTPEKQRELINQGVGVENSWHLTGDAVDMKPADWNKLPDNKKSELKGKYDVVYHNNHYHLEPKGSPKMQQGGLFFNPYKYF